MTLPVQTVHQDWRDDAACRDQDPELFFALDDTTAQRALAICAGCPVRSACLEHALANGERHGIWGGTTEHERRTLLRERRRAA